jgi:hypothetical protein
MLIDKYLIVQYLRQNGLSVPPAYADEYLKELARANGKSLEEFLRELYSRGITPSDLKRFIEMEAMASLGFQSFLGSKVDVSELEIEIERLKRGEVKYAKVIELIVLDKDKAEDLLKIQNLKDLDTVARELGAEKERLKVYRGDLVEALDREIWKADIGSVVVAEDEQNLYLAKILKLEREYSGRSEEEIRKEIISKKIEELSKEVLQKLRKKAHIEVFISSNSAN